MAQSQKDQIFEQLQQIQTENSELHERIAKLKAQRHLANEEDQEKPDNNQSQEYAIEIEKLKEQLNQEEANIVELKKNLNTLLSNQQTIQSKIDEENNQVFQVGHGFSVFPLGDGLSGNVEVLCYIIL